MTQESISYTMPDNKTRQVTVVNGQPYYLSTTTGAWFPFIMVQGTRLPNWENLSNDYNVTNLQMSTLTLYLQKDPHELLNICEGSVTTPDTLKLPEPYAGRIRNKQTLLDTIRLGTQYDENITSGHLTTEELEEAQKNQIHFEEDPKELSDPDQVNQWLIEHGATAPNLVLGELQEKKGSRKNSEEQLNEKKWSVSREENSLSLSQTSTHQQNNTNEVEDTKLKNSVIIHSYSSTLFSKQKMDSKKDNMKKIATGIFFTLVPVVAGLILDEITNKLQYTKATANFLKSPTPKLGDLPNGATITLGLVLFIGAIYYFYKKSQAKDTAVVNARRMEAT